MTDLIATIRVTDADAYMNAEDAAEELCEILSKDLGDVLAPIVVHILIENEDGRPLAERRIVGAEE